MESKTPISGVHWIMNLWIKYVDLIKQNCETQASGIKDMQYWRNNLFAGTIIYTFPLSLIALIPGIYWSLYTDKFFLACVDVFIILMISAMAFLPGIRISYRKFIFIFLTYFLGCVLLYIIGLYGPGLIYLQAACTFSVLIFHVRYAYLPAIVNSLICSAFAIAIPGGLLPWPADIQNSVGSWIAVSSNLLFMSFLSSALIPRLFNGLHKTIAVKKELRKQLSDEQESLRESIVLLEQKNSELEHFAYIASHDLQEPLRMITSFLQQLEKKYDPLLDEKGRKYIYFAVDGATRMRQIILDLLEYSRAGRTENSLEAIDVNQLVTELQILFSKQMEDSNAKITFHKLPCINSYSTPLRQLFQNLISNGLKYHQKDQPAELTISSIEHELFWEFVVADNGVGIAEEYHQKIFVLFQRLHTRDEYPGTGMGLALCKKIAENLGGKIWVKSQPGYGSSFHFTVKKNFIP